MFLRQQPDWVGGTIAFLCSLDPARAQLDDELSPSETERFRDHASTELSLGFHYNEIVDALFMKRPSGDDASHATTKDKNLGVIRWWANVCDVGLSQRASNEAQEPYSARDSGKTHEGRELARYTERNGNIYRTITASTIPLMTLIAVFGSKQLGR